MNKMSTEVALHMTYLRDPASVGEIDQERVLAELTTGEDTFLSRRRFSDYDHLVLGADRDTGRAVALLGARDGATAREGFVLLNTAFVTPSARGKMVMSRMIALCILRIAAFGPAPRVLVAPTSNPVWYRSLFELSQQFAGVFFPEPDSSSIRLDSAALAQRIAREIGPNLRFESATGTLRGGRTMAALRRAPPVSRDPRIDALFGQLLQPADLMLTVLDFRAKSESEILDNARRVYRCLRVARG